MRRLLPAALAAALVATGCNASFSTGEIKIDQKKAQDLARQIGAIRGPVKSASCPSGLKAKRGADFDCNLAYVDGTKATITIHQVDDKGRIRTSASDVH